MNEFVIKIEESEPKKQVTVSVEGKQFFAANLKVTNEELLDELTRFFLNCVRKDINAQNERKEAKAKANWSE